ncbi:hypothetical protein [Synechococcus phage DSL-LC07]|nr:hypothetical protein [Synechococcus phage DSL-LC07]
MEQRLKLNEFRVLYKTWRRGVPWLDHLLLGLLVWIEEKLINNRVKVEVDQAIEEYKKIEPPMPDMVTPVYTETPSASANSHSDTSTKLPEMRLTAPWYKDTTNTD